jgi:type II restriction enzyme
LVIRNLLLIPSFCFSVSALEKRTPLSPTARRAGWVGCNILLSAIPLDAKIKIVDDSHELEARLVRIRFDSLRALTKVNPKGNWLPFERKFCGVAVGC